MNRIEIIQAYLRKNMELIENVEKGKIEIHFSGSSISFSYLELEEKKVERKMAGY